MNVPQVTDQTKTLGARRSNEPELQRRAALDRYLAIRYGVRPARSLRALDAVHLATALALGSDLGTVHVYAAELARAAVE